MDPWWHLGDSSIDVDSTKGTYNETLWRERARHAILYVVVVVVVDIVQQFSIELEWGEYLHGEIAEQFRSNWDYKCDSLLENVGNVRLNVIVRVRMYENKVWKRFREFYKSIAKN